MTCHARERRKEEKGSNLGRFEIDKYYCPVHNPFPLPTLDQHWTLLSVDEDSGDPVLHYYKFLHDDLVQGASLKMPYWEPET
jgi:hypothetical protein